MEKMNKILIATLVAFLIVFTNTHCVIVAQAGEAGEANIANDQITQVLYSLFDALKTGDIKTLKHLFAGEMHARNKTLLEQNAGYPQFLRDLYQGALFEIKEISPDDKGYIASFTTFFSNGSKSITHLIFAPRARDAQPEYLEPSSLDVGPNGWVIIQQIVDK